MKKEREIIVCGPENFHEFREKLKEMFPAFYPVITQLFKSGLITGLRGATIELNINSGEMDRSEYYLSQLTEIKNHWARLNEWEMQFITSIEKKLEDGITLTTKQINQLSKINGKIK